LLRRHFTAPHRGTFLGPPINGAATFFFSDAMRRFSLWGLCCEAQSGDATTNTEFHLKSTLRCGARLISQFPRVRLHFRLLRLDAWGATAPQVPGWTASTANVGSNKKHASLHFKKQHPTNQVMAWRQKKARGTGSPIYALGLYCGRFNMTDVDGLYIVSPKAVGTIFIAEKYDATF
jgi:hypothetical protein